MRLHAIQTGTVAIKQRQVRGSGQGFGRRLNTMLDRVWTDPLPIYVWVIEHPEGIIVVDTGETARTTEPGYFPWWHPYYRLGVREWVRPEEEVGPQLRALGIPPEEVRWVVLTHLHSDHTGGLAHFPKAEILLSRTEYQSASGWQGQVSGYLPQHWPTWFDPTLISFAAASVGPFPLSYSVTRAQDVLLVPTAGHTAGHLSVVVLEDDHVLFLAGDTSYIQQLMLEEGWMAWLPMSGSVGRRSSAFMPTPSRCQPSTCHRMIQRQESACFNDKPSCFLRPSRLRCSVSRQSRW